MHPNIAPSDITYYVTKQPSFGTLELDSTAGHDDGKEDVKPLVKIFEQSAINENRLHYVQVVLGVQLTT